MAAKNLPYAIAFLFVPAMWASNIILVKDLSEDIPTFALVLITYGLGALTVLAARPLLKAPKFTKREWMYGALIGVMVFAATGFQFLGLLYTTPANSGLFTILYVIFIPVIVLIIKRRFSYRPLLFAVIGLIGVVVLSGAWEGVVSLNRGDAFTAIGAVFWALQFVLLEKYSPGLNSVNLTVTYLVFVTLAAAATTLIAENSAYGTMAPQSSWVASLVFMGVVTIGLCFLIQTFVQSKVPASTVAMLCCTQSLFALLFSLILGYDEVTLALIGGAALITVSAALSALYGQEPLIGEEEADGRAADAQGDARTV
ncbi:MAG: DMT family transporter [Candidatus Methanoplasma sp.]|jgi:drug/metabolite transporter (DMT)-like permease|nr:DMT family transporter [Candidatus Methanoplasma sp.]